MITDDDINEADHTKNNNWAVSVNGVPVDVKCVLSYNDWPTQLMIGELNYWLGKFILFSRPERLMTPGLHVICSDSFEGLRPEMNFFKNPAFAGFSVHLITS